MADVTTAPAAVVMLVNVGLKSPRLRAAELPVVVSEPNFWAVRLVPLVTETAFRLASTPARVTVVF